jgi:hypothetical protein
MEPLLVLLSGVFGRLSGYVEPYKIPAPYLLGLVFGLILGAPWYWLPAYVAAGVLGEATAPAPFSQGLYYDDYRGADWRKSKWWEIRSLPFVNITNRGVWNGLFYLPLFPITPAVLLLPLAYSIGWPVGAVVGKQFKHTKLKQVLNSEFWRQVITASLLLTLIGIL